MPYTEDSLVFTQDLTVADGKQIIHILTPIFDTEYPNRRKDSYTIRIRCKTGGDDLFALIYNDTSTVPIIVGTINSTEVEEHIIDVSYIVGTVKSWQVELVGQLSDFSLVDINIEFGLRPEQTTFYKHLLHGLGPNKKRIRVWPVIIDTIDGDVIITPYVDGVAQDALTVNCNYPKTHLYQFITDVFGIDYALEISGCIPFELFDVSNPVGVQILPIAKKYDQVGSEELFRYGKILGLNTRILTDGGTTVPFTIYFQDNEKWSGTIEVEDGKEDSIFTPVPKTVAGAVLRIEYGPCDFNFHRFYTIVKVLKSGRDTEAEWLPLTSDWEKKLSE